MEKQLNKYSANLFFGVSSIVMTIIISVCFYYIFNTSAVIAFLERNQISAYYVKDVILLLAIIFSCLALFITTIEFLLKKDLRFLTVFFSPVFIILLSAYFAVSYDFGNVARSKIGWFYNMPEGKSIGYPN